MTNLIDLPPSTRNKGNTSPVKTKTHIYMRKNKWGIVWSDTPVSGKRRNLIDKKLGEKIFIHPKSRVSHIGASSHNQNIQFEMELSRNWHWMWSNYYYYKKNFNVFTAIKKTYLRLISSFLKMSFYIFVNKKKYLIYRQRFTGLISAYLNKPSWYRPKVDFD